MSRNNSHHPVGNLIYQRLKSTGHEVFPVNPHMQTFEGDRCYPDLQSIPGGVDGVVIIDWIADAIGPFEMSEYLGLALIYAALAVTAPFLAAGRRDRSTG